MTKHIIAHVRLTDGTVRFRQMDAAILRVCLGGRGLGMHLLEGSADESPLIFIAGPLTDSAVPPGGRYCAVTRSADTGLPISLSSGTGWGTVLKQAGLDGILIEGEAPEWSWVSIENGTVRLHSAQSLMGMLTGETDQALKSLCGPTSSVLCIGPAGEKLVPPAAIFCGSQRAFSRAGIGKIMGAKKLKAIVVHAETGKVVPENACNRCTVPCGHASSHKDTAFSSLCNEYGLDCIDTAQAMDALGSLSAQSQWIQNISRPEAVVEPAPSGPKRRKQNLPEDLSAIVDSLGCCLFSASKLQLEDYAKMLTETTGEFFSAEVLLDAGMNILQLEQRIQSAKCGRSALLSQTL